MDEQIISAKAEQAEAQEAQQRAARLAERLWTLGLAPNHL